MIDKPSRTRSSLGLHAIVVMTLTVGAVVSGAAVCLGGADICRTIGARLPDRGLLAATAAPAVLSRPDLTRLAGRWFQEKDAVRLIVTPKGEVWSDRGSMQGTALPLRAGTTFVFGSAAFACAYVVTFQGAEAADFHLVDGTPGTPCPSGVFRRPPTL